MKTKQKTSRGFTLIEIMIVVAIIGILAAISIPNLLGAIERARKQTCAVNRLNINGAKLRWSIENNHPASATPTEEDLFGKNPYLEHKPNCPAGGAYALGAVQDKCTCSYVKHEN